MNRDATGSYRLTATAGETVRAFVPRPLPPVPPLAGELGDRYTRTSEYTPESYSGFDYEGNIDSGPEPTSMHDKE
jgi:hypothetical protein